MTKKRLLSWLTASALALSLLPASAFAAEKPVDGEYLLVNIPYAEFYAAETSGSAAGQAPVDTVTSATTSGKATRYDSVSYYTLNKTSTTIEGVKMPVFVPTEQAEDVKAALDNTDHKYVSASAESVHTWKTVTLEGDDISFGKAVSATEETLGGVTATLSMDTLWGDYLLTLVGEENSTFSLLDPTKDVYGVVLETKEGDSYGLRHLENIWLRNGQLAWSVGVTTTEPHGNTLSYAHYESMMGQTITTVKYLTTDGIYTVRTELYVPYKETNTLAVADASVADGKTTASVSGLNAAYDTFTVTDSVDTAAAITYADGALTWTPTAVQPGAYTLTASASNGSYADLTADFTLSTDSAAAAFDTAAAKLVALDGVSESTLRAYLSNITSVNVDGKDYAASGHGSKTIINTTDGSLNTSDNEAILGGETLHCLKVTSAGYPELTFFYGTDALTGSGTATDPFVIGSAEQLAAVSLDLAACYRLSGDIDLTGTAWTPIGAFVPDAEANDGETPDGAYAFTGTFDGGGYTISGLTVGGEDAYVQGLFGCVAGGTVKNVTIDGAKISGVMMLGAAVGYAYQAALDNVDVKNAAVTGMPSATLGAASMLGGVAGAGMDSTVTGCDVSNVTVLAEPSSAPTAIGGNSHDLGALGGGFEGCSVSDCTATDSTVTANGQYVMGVGGLLGCNFGGDQVANCAVSNVSVTANGNAQLVGGLLGYAGGGEAAGVPVTAITDAVVTGGSITVGADAYRVGGVIGGGFYFPEYKDYFPTPAEYSVSGGSVTGLTITAGAGSLAIGGAAGHAYCSSAQAAVSGVTLNGEALTGLSGVSETEESLPLYQVAETYQQLFRDGTFESTYNSLWHDYTAAMVGASNADKYAQMLKDSIGGTLYGQAALEAGYTPGAAQFACDFNVGGMLGGTIAFEGSRVSGYDTDGDRLFSHTYEYVGQNTLDMSTADYTAGMDVTVFKSTDPDAGEFTYIALCPDTPDETYHIEFRYGAALEDLLAGYTGDYAFWLAAGIPTDADETMYEQVIALFVTENLAEMAQHTDETLSQLSDVTGTWDCDVSAYPELAQLGVTSLSCVLSANGTGVTYANGKLSDSYGFYAYSGAEGSGIYLAAGDEGIQPSRYIRSGDTLTFTTLDGETITYTRRDTSGQVIVDGVDVSDQLAGASFDGLDPTDTNVFPDGADGAYLVTIGEETRLVGDTTLSRWTGTWTSWDNFIYPSERTAAQYPYLDKAWEEAYTAYAAVFAAAGVDITATMPNVDALKAYWHSIADTKTVADVTIAADGADYRITWLDADGTALFSDTYVMTGKMLKGFEGAAAYIFTAQDPTGGEYDYFIAMEPGYETTGSAPVAGHYHFQFGSDLNEMLVVDDPLYNSSDYGTNASTGRAISSDLANSNWYATVTDGTASALAQYNVILTMHRATAWTALPSSGSSSGGSSGGSVSPSVRPSTSTTTPGTATTSGYTDVPSGYWAESAIIWAKEQGYMNGTTSTTFSPATSVNRQQLWMVLGRMAGTDPADMAAARAWAMTAGLTDGTNPTNTMSRQQMVTMLYRYAVANGMAAYTGTLSGFPDVNAVADYATTAMAWAVANGIINGTSDGRLDPTGTATRAQFAVILQRFVSVMG